ncbi:MAG: PEP-CTERM sorting domain-containing protein [SAR202 cluster bacterium]|nr:PEP-CTERM sorting domain-containing protein [SAR202 cluster bacterium]
MLPLATHPRLSSSPTRRVLSVLAMTMALGLLLSGGLAVSAQVASQDVEFDFTFDTDVEGWTAGFADLPADYHQATYELDSEHRALPPGLEGSGIYIQGHNRSDDLFMYLKRQVNGLEPETQYLATITIYLATNVPEGLVGIGGSPGESVYVKAGATAIEPVVATDESGHLRVNIDKGNQAGEGKDMLKLGNVAHPEVTGDEYRIKTLDNPDRPLEVTTDQDGRVWLVVGTDSGFEGLSSIYYARISYVFSIIEEAAPVPPSVGDWAVSNRLLATAAALGGLLFVSGMTVLARLQRN